MKNFTPISLAPTPSSEDLAIYIHWPFCRSICPYCHFNRYVVDSVDERAWEQAFVQELAYWKHRLGSRSIVSIFFGGGTPSLMSPGLVSKILNTIAGLWSVSEKVEITLEMNPTDYTKAGAFAQAGINRISMGVQSFHDETLKFLGRTHRVEHIQEALRVLKQVGLRYSFDLIYGHKHHENAQQWAMELALARPWIDDHLSLYQLSYESGTPFYKKRHQELSDEVVLHLESLTEEALAPLGLQRYEVSNYARPKAHSVHNRMYWTYQDFLGLGPGAHGRITLRDTTSGALTKMATHNAGLPDVWMHKVGEQGNGMILDKPLTREQRFQEQLLMGLRLREGLPWENMLDPGEGLHKNLIGRIWKCLEEGLLEKSPCGQGGQRGTAQEFGEEVEQSLGQGSWKMCDIPGKTLGQEIRQKMGDGHTPIPQRWILSDRGRCVLNSVVDYLCQGPTLQ